MIDRSSLVKSAFQVDEYQTFDQLNCILKEFTINEVLPMLEPKNLVFVHTHFWSVNLGPNGDWCSNFPMYFGRKRDIYSFFAFFLLRGSILLKKFSLASFMFRDLHQKPWMIFERKTRDKRGSTKKRVDVKPINEDKNKGTIGCIKFLVPDIDMSDEREEVLKTTGLFDDRSIEKSIDEFIKENTEKHNGGVFVNSDKFNQLVDNAIKTEKGKELASKFNEQLQVKDSYNKSIEALLEDIHKTVPFREWNLGEELLCNFVKVIIAHNLLPKWRYLYILPSKAFREKGQEMGFGGLYVCSSDERELSKEILGELYVKVNLKYRGLGVEDWADKAKKEASEKARAAAAASILHPLKNRLEDLDRWPFSQVVGFLKDIPSIIDNREALLDSQTYLGDAERIQKLLRLVSGSSAIGTIIAREWRIWDLPNSDIQEYDYVSITKCLDLCLEITEAYHKQIRVISHIEVDDRILIKFKAEVWSAFLDEILKNTQKHAEKRNGLKEITMGIHESENNYIWYFENPTKQKDSRKIDEIKKMIEKGTYTGGLSSIVTFLNVTGLGKLEDLKIDNGKFIISFSIVKRPIIGIIDKIKGITRVINKG